MRQGRRDPPLRAEPSRCRLTGDPAATEAPSLTAFRSSDLFSFRSH